MDIERFKPIISKILTDNPKSYIQGKIKELLEKKPVKLSQLLQEIKKSSGVYLIYEKPFKEEGFIYVGETDDLQRRLKGDIGRGKKEYHTFLNKLAKEFKLTSEKNIKKKVEEYFLFSVIQTSSKEIAFVIEGVIIRHYWRQLKNKPKKYQKQEITCS